MLTPKQLSKKGKFELLVSPKTDFRGPKAALKHQLISTEQPLTGNEGQLFRRTNDFFNST